MRKLKIMLSTVFTIAITAICIYSLNPMEAQAKFTPYMTVDYECTPEIIIPRCDYGNFGCDISGQPFCPGEVE